MTRVDILAIAAHRIGPADGELLDRQQPVAVLVAWGVVAGALATRTTRLT